MTTRQLLSRRFSRANRKPQRALTSRGRDVQRQIVREISCGTMTMENSCCPCGEEKFDRLAERDVFALPIGTVICKSCGLIRSNPRPTPETYARYYQEYMFRDLYSRTNHAREETAVDKFIEHQRKRGQEILDVLAPFLPSGRPLNVLEVGSGPGGLMIAFQKQGHRCVGIDLSDQYIETGHSLGLDLRVGTLQDFPDLREMDVILTNHYLEHVSDLNREIEEFGKRLRADTGLLYVGVPGFFSLEHMLHHDFLELIQFSHTFIYDLASLDVTLGRFGFRREFGNEEISSVYRNSGKALAEPAPDEVTQNIEAKKDFLRRMERKRRLQEPYRCLVRSLDRLLGIDRADKFKRFTRNLLKRNNGIRNRC